MPVRVEEYSQTKAVPQLISQKRQVLGQPMSIIAANKKAARKAKT
jgi:hypothetical protein